MSQEATPETVARLLEAAPEGAMFSYLRRLILLDRYQASDGIVEAAEAVAEWAVAAGLRDVAVEQHVADGRRQWWTFDAPVSWTPCRAVVWIVAADGSRRVAIDHGRDPFSLATYSAPTRPGGACFPVVIGGETEDVAGKVILISAARGAPPPRPQDLANGHAAGFITDAFVRTDFSGAPKAGRIELRPGSGLFGFSVTPPVMEELERSCRLGERLAVEITTSGDAPMPVATATLPGHRRGEIWIISHLCHPRPGANDNGSGVAASLGLAAALVAVRDGGRATRRTIRFVWGPEFVGTVAMLAKLGPPDAVINLDMVGENQSLCASPFVLERAPDDTGGLVNALAERAVAETFRQTRAHGGTWRTSPFLGFSDHALFADSSIAAPAVQFCHPADRFNHSGADTLDKVSGIELRRSVAAAGALLFDLDSPLDPAAHRFIEKSCARARVQAAASAASAGDERWAAALLRNVESRCEELLAARDPLTRPQPSPEEPGAPQRRWEGPVNVRALLDSVEPTTRRELHDRIGRDKSFYSRLLNVGIRIDGRRSRETIMDQAGFACGRPVEPAEAEQIWSVFEEAGFVA